MGAAQRLGLNDFAFAIYGVLDETVLPRAGEPTAEYDASRKDLASLIQEAIEPTTRLVDWPTKEDVQREMRQRIKKQLRVAKHVDPTKIETTTGRIVDLAKVRRGR